jgi:hypothetical protein
MEVPQETLYVAILNKKNVLFSSSFFNYTKSKNRRAEQVLPGGTGICRRGRKWGKGVGG